MTIRVRTTASVLLLIACLAILPVGAQDAGVQDGAPAILGQYLGEGISVRTAGGGSFQGVFIGLESDRIELLLTDGQILLIARPELVRFTIVDQSEGSRSFYEDSASNQLLIMPRAFRIANNRTSWDIGAVVPLIIDGDSVSGLSLNTPVIPIPILSLTWRIR